MGRAGHGLIGGNRVITGARFFVEKDEEAGQRCEEADGEG
jgi:hypothetical protein